MSLTAEVNEQLLNDLKLPSKQRRRNGQKQGLRTVLHFQLPTQEQLPRNIKLSTKGQLLSAQSPSAYSAEHLCNFQVLQNNSCLAVYRSTATL